MKLNWLSQKVVYSGSRLTVVLLASLVFSGCNAQLKGGIQVSSADVPATVYLDGKVMDKTPYINKELKSGDYTLEIRPDDATFVPYQTKVSLKQGVLSVVSWQPGTRPETSGGMILETEPLRDKKASELVITTIPDGGIIYVDGVARGFAPVTVQGLTKGDHQLEVRLPSYQAQLQPINILEGHRILITVKLAKQDYKAPAASPSTKQATASPSAELASRAKILKTNFFQDGKEVLRVRADATGSSAELGFADVGKEYQYLKESKAGWVKIQFGSQVGWVSRQFVEVNE